MYQPSRPSKTIEEDSGWNCAPPCNVAPTKSFKVKKANDTFSILNNVKFVASK